jgi:biopolymer transport protein ExbD
MARTTAVRFPQVASEINVTPLVDVCLVLLIIFMLVTPLLPGTSVLLPETVEPQPILERPSQLTITIEQGGGILVGRNRLLEADLVRELSPIYAASPEHTIVIKADRRLKYERVREVIKRVRQAGFERVGLITRQSGRAHAA